MGEVCKMWRIPYGESNFELIRNKRFLYVDKTHFLEQLESTSKIIHLRPRRFGKSLFISMLESYYDIVRADKFDNLFMGLHVHAHPTPYRNSYYILRFNFSGIATTDFETIMDGFLGRVKDGIDLFISKYQLNIKVANYKTPAEILDSLLTAFSELNLEHKIYILIDEYDHFTNAVLNNGLDEFMSLVTRGGVVRSFYEVIKLKSELGIVERFFMTGVMSVSLDSMTSGFNIATNMTTDETFADMVGFTSDEVKCMLNTTLQSSRKEDVCLTQLEQEEVYSIWKQNYNGYLFSEESDMKVFNSTLIMYYLQRYIERKKHPRSLVDPNLNQSGSTIKQLADLKNQESNYKVVEEIVKERVVSGELSTFIDIDKQYERNDFITLLFNIGLLTIKEAGVRTKFEIPNKVIETVYLQYLSELEQRNLGCKIDVLEQELAIDELAEDGKINKLTTVVSEFLMHTSGRNKINFDEKYIKLIYSFIMSTTNQYFIYDEYPVRQGYGDLVALKTPASYATYELLLELKYLKQSETTEVKIEKEFEKGVKQIEGYMMDKRLAQLPHLKKFVVVFSGFEVARLEEV